MTKKQVAQILVLMGWLLTTSVWGMGLPKQPKNYTALSPIFGYDPVYGSILGGAVFSYPANEAPDKESEYRQLFFMGTLGGQFRFSADRETRQPQEDQKIRLSFGIDNFFDYEFLNGSDQYVAYDRWRLQSELEYSNGFAPNWYGLKGAALESETHQKEGDWGRVYPIIGVQFDDRNRSLNPSSGRLFTVKANALPEFLQTEDQLGLGTRLNVDYRHFWSVSSKTVLAARLEVEITDGRVFDTSLGGANQLRGYVNERFVGDQKWVSQLEWRFPLYRWVSGVTFVEYGQIAQDDQWQDKTSTGLGLRFGLPPDGAMTVRVDMGFSQAGVSELFVNFNHAY